MQPQKKTQKPNLGETVATRIPADILAAIDAEIQRREGTDADPASRSTVIRESLRKQLLKSKSTRKAERIGRSVMASKPKCEAIGCGKLARHMDAELNRDGSRTRHWWCRDHKTEASINVDFVVEVRAVPMPSLATNRV